jgi:hypothetical protein
MSDTIAKFGLAYGGKNFQLTNLQTDCLAKDKCGIPAPKVKMNLADIQEGKYLHSRRWMLLNRPV